MNAKISIFGNYHKLLRHIILNLQLEVFETGNINYLIFEYTKLVTRYSIVIIMLY